MKKNYAFSLIELMISLITISCITAAFAPVISKRLSANSTMVSSGLGSVTVKCQDKFGQYCELCYKTRCIVCTRTCASNEYKDIPTCTCKNCNKYDANCISCDDEKCKKCRPGYRLVSGKCEICPEGYSCDGGSSKTKCLKGTYAPQGSSACKECNAGYYSNVDGAKTCSPCPKKQYAPDKGSASCKPCPVGTKGDAEGLAVCTPCPAGTYQDQTGQEKCENAPVGYYTDIKGEENPKACPAGQYQNQTGQTGCKDCQKNEYQDQTGQEKCKACPVGQYQDQIGQSSCKDCPLECSACQSSSQCSACESEYHLENNSCVPNFTDKYFDKTETWYVPTGVTKISYTIIDGGKPSTAGDSLEAGTKKFYSSETLSLTGAYAALKGQTITIKMCGAGGENSANVSYTKAGANKWYGSAGSGAAGGSGSCTATIDTNATSLNVTVGLRNGGGTAIPGRWCSIYRGCKKSCQSSCCHKNCGSGYQYAAAGGNGGGASIVTDGTFTKTAGGGGGGGAGNTCNEGTDDPHNSWTKGGDGGKGGGGNFGGAGGVGNGNRGEYNHNGNPGSPGTTDCNGDSFSKSNYCGKGQNGYVEITYGGGTTMGKGGNSGYCKTGTLTIPSGTTSCKMTIGASGGLSSIKCGSASASTGSSGSINNASGSDGGAGFTTNCSNGQYGAGGDASADGKANNGKSGYIYIKKAN